ncbi:MAG: hypothetical protein WCX31_12465 [Salinivirgaceae bacterium]
MDYVDGIRLDDGKNDGTCYTVRFPSLLCCIKEHHFLFYTKNRWYHKLDILSVLELDGRSATNMVWFELLILGSVQFPF